MSFTMPDPPDSSYPWKTGQQIFGFPLMTVFAQTSAEAMIVAGYVKDSEGWRRPDGYLAQTFEATMDSVEATDRLGLFGKPIEFMEMCRGE